MPTRPRRPCVRPGCKELTISAYCEVHDYERNRGNSTERGYNSKWRTARVGYLRKHPHCVMCGEPAIVVDHIVPHRGDMKRFWDSSNWQPLCKRHHDQKTVLQDGGMGRD